MAGNEESQEKTEEATPRKLRDARKKGQVAKSRDLNSVFLLLTAFVALAFLDSMMGASLRDFLIACFAQIGEVRNGQDPTALFGPLFRKAGEVGLITVGPIALIAFITSLLVNFLQVGAVFSTEPVKFQINRINPIQGFKNIFKLRSLIELIKSSLKMAIVFLIAYMVLMKYREDLVYSVTAGVQMQLILAGKILARFIIWVCILFLAIALADLLYQRWQHAKDLRMSKYEVMQEFKRDEGDPMLKSHRRQMHQELTSSDIASVAKSDVVVVNPIHLAIAVKYDKLTMGAPQVMVKGQRLVAEQIRTLAKEAGVPIVENVPLAHALFQMPIGEEIPEDLYEIMAEILSFVYRLRQTEDGASP